MAFNPFQVFRKHKRTGLAALAIMAMFLFVLSSGVGGGADPLDRLASLLGGRGFRENDIAFLNGKPVSYGELTYLRHQRELANAYMMNVAERVANNFEAQSRAGLSSKDNLPPEAMQNHGVYARNAQILNSYVYPPRFQFMTGGRQRLQRASYFEPEVDFEPYTAAKLVDFMVWKQMAKKLGINMTDEAVKKELNRILLDGLKPQVDRGIVRTLENDPRFGDLSLAEALRDEFNVRMAKAAVLGDVYPPMATARVPVAVTPNEFRDFFNDQRTEMEMAFLPVRVEDYVNQVTAQPTEADLQRLYDRYKEQEYDPESRVPGRAAQPGFKQPRRVQVQFVGGDPDSPYYQQQAQEWAKVHDGLRLLIAGVPTTPLEGLLPQAVRLAVPEVIDLPLAADYYRQRFITLNWPDWSDEIRAPLRNETVFQPFSIASVIGQAQAVPLVWPAWQAQAVAHERQARADLAVSMIFSTSPFAAAAIVAKAKPNDSVLEYQQVQDWLRERYLNQLARGVLASNLDVIRKKIEELQKAKKLDDLDKVVADLAAKYHLQTGKSGLRDLVKDPLGDDAGLQALRDVYLRLSSSTLQQMFRFPEDTQAKYFGYTLFGSKRPFEIETWGYNFGNDAMFGQDAWKTSPHLYLTWKTDEQPARILPLSNPAVRQEVEKAWRMLEARKLAKKAAEDLAKDAAALGGDVRKLHDFALRNKEDLIVKDLPKLAKRIKVEALRPEFPLDYRPPTIPENRIPDIGSPGEPMFGNPPDLSYRRFMDKVLELKDQPDGAAVAVTNRPETTYYVAIALKKSPPTEEEFLRAYKEATGTGQRQGELFRLFMQTRATKFYEQFMEALRQEMKLEVNESKLDAFDGNRGEGG